MEKNLCSFRDNAGGECGADPRNSTNKCEVVKLQSCLKEISNLWHCRQMDAEKRQQRDEVNCLRKTSSDPHKLANFRLLQIVGFAKKSLGHAVAYLDDATAEGDVASATQELHRREIRAHIQEEVCISHPICYDQYNICTCELVQKSKLLCSVHSKMLQKICETFDITHVTEKRKAPYIAKLVELVRGCSCQTE